MKTPIDDFDFNFAGPVVIAVQRRTLFTLFLALASTVALRAYYRRKEGY
jgi:hypothetical protein